MLSSVVPVLALRATRGRAVFNTTIGFVFLIQQGPLDQRSLAGQEQRTTFIFCLRQQPLSTESVSDSRHSQINFYIVVLVLALQATKVERSQLSLINPDKSNYHEGAPNFAPTKLGVYSD